MQSKNELLCPKKMLHNRPFSRKRQYFIKLFSKSLQNFHAVNLLAEFRGIHLGEILMFLRKRYLPTEYVVRQEGYVLTRVCPSIHPSVCLSTGGYPRPGPAGGGVPAFGGYPNQRGPTQGTPSQVRREGYPNQGDPPGVP